MGTAALNQPPHPPAKPNVTTGTPGSIHHLRNGRLDTGTDPPVLQGSYKPSLPIPLPCPFPSPLISSSPSPEEEGRAWTAIPGATVPGQRDECGEGTSTAGALNIAGVRGSRKVPMCTRPSCFHP
ncbi:hypothetical protein CIB84_008093 [Bambusicola thoracicus]|uniref:Uncharacterized protein n=1 Tax=Bambusicola thoracicus TaxID=9083 RepID=A0A2P4SVK7_BAMTH|nr:hypothetical protein CIB84_008093 [Bambusicola thoracicus]